VPFLPAMVHKSVKKFYLYQLIKNNMTPLFKKLNFKAHATIVAINAPASFEAELKAMESEAAIIKNLKKVKQTDFALCFATTQQEIDSFIKEAGGKLTGDAVLWFCYPKMSSKKYRCEFNRDTGWAVVAQYDFEPVRMVAIDEDWSALRFRKVAFIKTITRRESYALTTEAKKRTTQKGK
jgi:hypothetical protein